MRAISAQSSRHLERRFQRKHVKVKGHEPKKCRRNKTSMTRRTKVSKCASVSFCPAVSRENPRCRRHVASPTNKWTTADSRRLLTRCLRWMFFTAKSRNNLFPSGQVGGRGSVLSSHVETERTVPYCGTKELAGFPNDNETTKKGKNNTKREKKYREGHCFRLAGHLITVHGMNCSLRLYLSSWGSESRPRGRYKKERGKEAVMREPPDGRQARRLATSFRSRFCLFVCVLSCSPPYRCW